MTDSTWTDTAISKKLDALRQLCLASERPPFFPETLLEFCEWADEADGIRHFTKPIIYKAKNESSRKEAQRLIDVGKQRWKSSPSGSSARAGELESLTRMLASRYHQERQLVLDAKQEAAALRASVDSLSAKLRELTGSRQVNLVPTDH